MSEATLRRVERPERRPLGATIWFVWMVAMWAAFFLLLFTDRIERMWTWVRDLPLVVEFLLWVALILFEFGDFPMMRKLLLGVKRRAERLAASQLRPTEALGRYPRGGRVER